MKPISGVSYARRNEGKTINGVPYPNGIVMPVMGCREVAAEYNLGRRWTMFRAKVGLDDSAEEDTKATFQVYVDGAQASSGNTLGIGEQEKIKVPVTNVLRLKIIVLFNGDRCDFPGYVLWADARVTK